MPNTWKEKVLQLMTERGISQKQLASLSGITESSISRYLRSEQRPRVDVVINIAKALHVDPQFLLSDEEQSDESAYSTIATAIARKGKELSLEEKTELIKLILGENNA